MKVLNVNMSLDPVAGGGTAERTFQMSRFLAKAGIECIVLTTDLGLTPKRIKDMDGVKVVAFPCLVKRFYVPKISYGLIKRIVADIDVFHLMGHWTVINAIVYFIGRSLNKPYVVCPAGALQIYGRSKIIKKIYNWVIGKSIIRNANGHIAITKDEKNQFQDYGVDVGKVSIISNGINPEDFKEIDAADFRGKYGIGNAPFIIFVGRLNSIKGPDLLLGAFCKLKEKIRDFHLVFVGPDEGMLAELKEKVANDNVGDRVHFIDYLGGIEKSNAYHAAELVVIPSRQEAMSFVVLEAGITGTPVLITDQCGFSEVASIGGGYVVDASIEGIEKGLIEILTDPNGLQSKGINLKKYIYTHFLWDLVIDKYIKLYSEILGVER